VYNFELYRFKVGVFFETQCISDKYSTYFYFEITHYLSTGSFLIPWWHYRCSGCLRPWRQEVGNITLQR